MNGEIVMPLSLKMGQIVFYLVREKGKIEPLRVVEELSRKTMEGTETVYMLLFPDLAEPVAHNTLKGDIFTSIDDIQKTMTERSNAAIKKLIEGAVMRAQQVFPDVSLESSIETHEDIPFVGEEDDGSQVMEVDGQLVKIRSVQLPDGLKY